MGIKRELMASQTIIGDLLTRSTPRSIPGNFGECPRCYQDGRDQKPLRPQGRNCMAAPFSIYGRQHLLMIYLLIAGCVRLASIMANT